MICSNPACTNELFKVTVQHRSIDADHPDRLPVKIVCAHCKKPFKAWITNEQMKQMLDRIDRLVQAYDSLVRLFGYFERQQTEKPWWKFW